MQGQLEEPILHRAVCWQPAVGLAWVKHGSVSSVSQQIALPFLLLPEL